MSLKIICPNGHLGFAPLKPESFHTFVTRLLDAKAPLEWVNQLAGHKSFTMTKRYDHAECDRYVPAIKALDEASPIDREALIASIRQPA
jgi:site-specific recombinase XerC